MAKVIDPRKVSFDDMPATERQLAYVASLRKQRDVSTMPDSTTESLAKLDAGEQIDRYQVSRLIDELKACDFVARATSDDANPAQSLQGFWITADQQILKVQVAVHGSGREYAKVLDVESGRFEYKPGGMAIVRAESTVRLTVEQAAKLGHLYGRCVLCGATLTDERSIEAGIGPVCAKRL